MNVYFLLSSELPPGKSHGCFFSVPPLWLWAEDEYAA